MSKTWHLEELRAHIRAQSENDKRLVGVVNSIGRSIWIFNYHLYTARDALKGIIDESDHLSMANFELVSGISDKQKEYDRAKITHEANLIGALQTTRNIYDMFSQLVNGLLLSSSIPVEDCNISRVVKKMADSELKRCLAELLDSHWFAFVAGFVNTTKHRQLVQHQFSISFEEGAVGIQIGAFEYNRKQFPPYWSDEVLRGVLSVKNKIVDCGCALNAMCFGESPNKTTEPT
jgi:hypothetical protein